LVCGVSVSAHGQDLKWHSFEDALAIADSTANPILVDVWAPWCGWCHKMRSKVYPQLSTELNKHFVLTRLNRDDNRSKISYKTQQLSPLQIAQQLRADKTPTVVLLNSKGNYLLHLSGFRKAKTLRPILQFVSSDAYEYQTFTQFLQKL
jgi:thioredoxin-like negative regulator of GroEL